MVSTKPTQQSGGLVRRLLRAQPGTRRCGRNAVCWHLTAFIALDARYLDIIVGIPTLEV